MKRDTAIKLAAYILIGAGLTIWCDIARGLTFNADQLIGLTVAFAVAGLIVHEIVMTYRGRNPAPAPQIDIRTLFEEV